MAATPTHLAIADRICSLLGDGVIKNLPLFFGGNIAPDAVHSKQNYRRADKDHSHLRDGIHLYGYGNPESARLLKNRVNAFVSNYYMTAGESVDLYFGYIVHLLADELYMLSAMNQLEAHLIAGGRSFDDPESRAKLAGEISDDPQAYNPDYVGFFRNVSSLIDIEAIEFPFVHHPVDLLEAVWDYEIRDYVRVDEINTNKRWVINTFFDSEKPKSGVHHEKAMAFIDFAASDIINRLSCSDGIVRLLE